MTYETKKDPFYASFTSQGADFASRVDAANPILPGRPGYAFAGPDFFRNMKAVDDGAGFL